jgi:hypothetical protein
VEENVWRGAAKFGLCAAPIMEEREWGGPVGGHIEGRMGGSSGRRWCNTRLVDDGHDPGAATSGHARERQGKREKGESRGGW